MKEQAVLLGEAKSLVGILTDPPTAVGGQPKPAVILLNSGIVHRVGPGRLYVKVARALAHRGFAALRFDFSGIGDSGVRQDHLPFEKSAVRETQDAMDWLSATRGITHFILFGGCSGARIALRTAGCDRRVVGSILVNLPLAEDNESNADPERMFRSAAHRYWSFALFDLKSWRNLLTGRANYRNLIQVLKAQTRSKLTSAKKISHEAIQFREQLRLLAGRNVHLMFACAQDDPSANDLQEAGGDEMKHFCKQGRMALKVIPRADHTFSSLYDQERLLQVILDWVGSTTPPLMKPVRILEQVATPYPT